MEVEGACMKAPNAGQHWLVDIALGAGLPGARDLTVDLGAPIAEAWSKVADGCGLTPEALAQHVAAAMRLPVA